MGPGEEPRAASSRPVSENVPVTAAGLALFGALWLLAGAVYGAFLWDFEPLPLLVSVAAMVPLGVGGVKLIRAKKAGQVLVATGCVVALLSVAAFFVTNSATIGLAAVYVHSHLLATLVGLYGFPYVVLAGSFLAPAITLILALSPKTSRWIDAN